MTSTSSKVGATRKSRRQRLPISSAGSHRTFSFSEADWTRVGSAYSSLTEEDRQQITQIVDKYLRTEIFERNAPFLDDAIFWLQQLRQPAIAFWKICLEGGKPGSGAATLVARQAFEQNLRCHVFENGAERKFDTVVSAISAVVTAFDDSVREIEAQPVSSFEEGRRWQEMIRQLSDHLRERGFKVTAAKDVDKVTQPTSSPFVAFVREIQYCLPPESRRHTASDIALAQGISLARRKSQKRKISAPRKKTVVNQKKKAAPAKPRPRARI